ncbi:NGG1p interacting factor NIF3 [Patescibacteria group bacterium]|nr:NGG1p interacting factor NIF3 [Patescibacteria group bacterium]MBU1673205.1 NGG1p interacting factor NIF3 [Patescibacteria group bacterium]MBU1963015.1 NGG1p interacting factor NIF3 [Patescibacteria group bacterium]
MNPQQIYELGIKMAMKADLRGEATVKKRLLKAKEKLDNLKGPEKKAFDNETLINPYADSRLYAKDLKKPIKKVMAGIDMEEPEVMLASQAGDIDMVIAHHPQGHGLAGLHEVMDLQAEILAKEGIPINVAQNVIKPRIAEVSRSVAAANHFRTINMAEYLNMPFLCAHTFCDNLVTKHVNDLVIKNRKKLDTVGELLEFLKEIPEYAEAIGQKAGPQIFVGSPDNFTGKIVISEMTGGTNGSKDIYEKMAQAGIGTVVGMHMSEEWKKEAEKNHINVIIAGHIASDSIGMNLFLDELEKNGIEVVPMSGLIRYKRFKPRAKKK